MSTATVLHTALATVGGVTADFSEETWWLSLIKAVFIMLFLILSTILAIWAERRVLGRIQTRPGPNVNLQVACTLSGHLAWVSDPLPGRAHDVTALRASGLLDLPASDLPTGTKPPRHLGDKGYTGTTMITPYRKPPHRPLTSTEKDANHAHGRIRYKIERTIANIKTWRILHNDYRRPLNTFNTTITAVLALIFTYNTP